jgi:hypothetical protein
MKKQLLILMIAGAFLWAGGSKVDAQWISPGQLTEAHKKLEGIMNCLKCHSLTRSISDSACTACHEKLNERLRKKRGFHAQAQGTCVACHTDHKGRDYDITGLDKETFDHNSTGYVLEDRHKVSCQECHKKKNTYLDLTPACMSCHNDVHKGTMSEDCLKCHSFKGWKYLKFDHDRNSEYKLTGKHAEIVCESCHPKYSDEKREGHGDNAYSVLKFKPLKYERCSDCHADIHQGTLKEKQCTDCHITEGWKVRVFNHDDPALSDYRLLGRHKNVTCELCHREEKVTYRKAGKNTERAILHFKPVKHASCSSCHFDVHKGQFGKQKCDVCHSLKNEWKDYTFNHGAKKYNGYKLEGRHKDVNCEKCHERSEIRYSEFNRSKKASVGTFKPLSAASCGDCHFDVHMGQLNKKTCDACHSMNNAWKDYAFDHQSEKYSSYKLEGRHIEVTCEKCHERSEITYRESGRETVKHVLAFKPLKGERCEDCHKEEHKKRFIGIREVRDVTCATCHSVDKEWKDYEYKHESDKKFKKYSLEYKAEAAECEKCHTCGFEVFCTSCCIRRCMPCNFRQKIRKNKDSELFDLIYDEP